VVGGCFIAARSTSLGVLQRAHLISSQGVAAKHGIVGLTKVAALETAEEGITCNAICPGYVYTPLVEAQIDGQARAHGISREAVIHDVLLAQQPNKRFATVEELGELTVFLASDAAASITPSRPPDRSESA
jgi:3-hydroxybutyrate dehydrogenase